MSYNYFYGQSGELFSYFRIPKALFQDRRFRQLSTDARTLYGILLDRMSLSAKNDWLDEQGRVYIVYTVREVQESLCCAEHKAVKLFRELEDIDLIERKRRGLKAIYKDNADTIVGNMDSQIFLGGSEPTTLKDLSEMLGKETIDAFNTSDTRGNSPSYGTTFQKMGHELLSRDELAVLDGGKCILQLRGVRPFLSDKYDLTQHPNYKLTSDYDPKNTFDIEKYLNRKEKIHPGDEFIVVDADSLPSA